jgi:hypothetical protein
MQRRKLLAGIGSMAAGGAAMVGTGAFDSAQLNNRDFKAVVRSDNNSNQLLRLRDDLSRYASIDGDGELIISIDALAQNSTYTFSNLFRVENNGRNGVRLKVEVTGNAANAIESVPAINKSGNEIADIRRGVGSIELDAGKWVEVGAVVKVTDGTDTFGGEFTVIANEN